MPHQSEPPRGSKMWGETAEGGASSWPLPDNQVCCKRPARTRRAIRIEEELRENQSDRKRTLRRGRACRAREHGCPGSLRGSDSRKTTAQKRSRARSRAEREWQASTRKRAAECAIARSAETILR